MPRFHARDTGNVPFTAAEEEARDAEEAAWLAGKFITGIKKGAKTEASRRILAIAPEWKQRNLLARMNELLEKGKANWSQAEQDEVAAMKANWQSVKAIRTASNDLEAAIDGMTTEQLQALDVTDDKHWV